MGSALEGCKGCEAEVLPFFETKEFHEISSYYTSKLSDFQEILPDIPQYENPVYSRLVNDLRKREEKF